MSRALLICAAGRSERFGPGHKLLTRLGGTSLLRRAAHLALGTAWPVWVALPRDAPDLEAEIADLPVTAIAPVGAGEGLGGTLRDATRALPPDLSELMVLLADLPALRPGHLTRLITASDDAPGPLIMRLAGPNGTPGHPVIFKGAALAAFANLSGDGGAGPILKTYANQTQLIRCDDDAPCRDIDVPSDLRRFTNADAPPIVG